MKFLQLNGYHFSVSVEEAVNMCVTIAVESLTDESLTTYAKWGSLNIRLELKEKNR